MAITDRTFLLISFSSIAGSFLLVAVVMDFPSRSIPTPRLEPVPKLVPVPICKLKSSSHHEHSKPVKSEDNRVLAQVSGHLLYPPDVEGFHRYLPLSIKKANYLKLGNKKSIIEFKGSCSTISMELKEDPPGKHLVVNFLIDLDIPYFADTWCRINVAGNRFFWHDNKSHIKCNSSRDFICSTSYPDPNYGPQIFKVVTLTLNVLEFEVLGEDEHKRYRFKTNGTCPIGNKKSR